ncbi:MAG TPA: hypothetical protein VNX29_00830 [Kaistia sp.]|nr:hypothetical protein [Kaistia sp.]
MNRYFTNTVLPIVSMICFEITALVIAVQGFVYMTQGKWISASLGDILETVGIGPPPADWMNGSVYDMLWNEPLALTCLVLGLLAATYAGIGRYEEEETKPAFVYP